ncbi:MAG: class I SAM-dependent methyltransferase [Pseudonocardiaceae bacterium]
MESTLITDALARIGAFWDADAATYDQATGHHPQTAIEWAAWRAALIRLLPPPPARILDVGAGTGFLSLAAAQLGYTVTAVDLSPAMLQRLTSKATAAGLLITAVAASADELPAGTWEAVISRHLLWTLPDPLAALRCWRTASPEGRLLLLESLWGAVADPIERGRSQARDWLRRLRGIAHDHHAPYDDAIRSALPLGQGTTPERLIDLVGQAGWPASRIERLTDIEWAMQRQLPLPDRLLGVTPRFAVTAG